MHKEKKQMNFYTTTEAAEILNLSPSSLRVYLGDGEFPNARKEGRDWKIPEPDLNDFKSRRRKRGRPVTTGAGLRRKDRQKKGMSRSLFFKKLQ